MAVVVGAVTGLAILALNKYLFAPYIGAAPHTGVHPTVWQGFLACFYGGIDEEILMRLGLLSVFALILRTVVRAVGVGRGATLPAGVFWAANLIVAILFGLAHLPAIATVAPLTSAVILRAVVLSGIGGLVFGDLYRRFGLESAMVAHFSGDIVLHVLIPIG
jgi:hypothetical protein